MSRFFFVALSWSACFVFLAWSLHIPNHNGQGLAGVEEPSANFRSVKSTVYVIRHGEKPEDGRRGLSRLGRKRAECILELFGPQSGMNISYIIAAPTAGRVKSSRSIDTVKPLAHALNTEIDSYCGAGNAKCVAKRVKEVQETALDDPVNVLIVGRHSKIRKIVKALGVEDPPKYPDEYGLTWQVKEGELEISQQDCPEMDDLRTLLDLTDEYACADEEDNDDLDEGDDLADALDVGPKPIDCNLDDEDYLHEHRPAQMAGSGQFYFNSLHGH